MPREIKLRWLMLGAMLSSIGTSFVWPLTTVYMNGVLHKSLTEVGVVLLLYSGTNVVGSYLAGRLFDRMNPYWLVLGGIIIAGLAMVVLTFQNGWPIYPIFLSIIGFCNGWLLTLINSLGTTIRSKDGRYIFNMLYFVQNLGIVIGTAVVGFLYHGDVSPMFAITATLYFMYLIVAAITYRVHLTPKTKQADDTELEKLPRANMKIIYAFFIGLGVIWIMYEQWVSNLSVYVLAKGIPLHEYSLLWTLNAGLIVVFQIALNWVDHWIKNIYAQVYVGMVMCALSFVVLMFSNTFAMFALAMTILTMGEATAFPSIPAIVNSLSPTHSKGKYQGTLNAFASVGKALGPLFGGVIIENGSYQLLFIVCTGSIFLVLIVNMIIDHRERASSVLFK